jgi:hypothetical protein
MNDSKIDTLIKRISRIKRELMDLGEMRPGTLSKQDNVCGNPGCRCKDPVAPMKHGPYYQLSYSRHGKSKTMFVRKEMAPRIRRELKNYKRFVTLREEWIDVSIELSRLRGLGKGAHKVT